MRYAQLRARARTALWTLSRLSKLAVFALAVICCAGPAFAGIASATAETGDIAPLIAGMIGLGIVDTAGNSAKELREMRGKVAAKIEELRMKNDDEKHDWTAEDQAEWTEVFGDYQRIDRAATAAEINDRSRAPDNPEPPDDDFDGRNNRRPGDDGGELPLDDRTRELALTCWARGAAEAMPSDDELAAARRMRKNPNARSYTFRILQHSHFKRANRNVMWTGRGDQFTAEQRHRNLEERDMSVGTLADGGYTVPEGFVNELERTLQEFGGPRQVARIIRTETGSSLPWPTVNDVSNVGAILAENTTIGASVDSTFGVVTLGDYKYTSTPILISSELFQDSAFNMADILPDLLGERLGRIQSTHFTTGDGTTQPEGVVTGSTLGKTAASATAFDPDEIRELMHSVDPAYRRGRSVGWMLNDTSLLAISNLKQDSKYVWQEGMTQGAPNTIFGRPYTINQDMADAATTTKPVLFGDYDKFVIRDAGMVRLYRLEERYRDLDQTAFIAFMRSDSKILQSGAIKHMQMA